MAATCSKRHPSDLPWPAVISTRRRAFPFDRVERPLHPLGHQLQALRLVGVAAGVEDEEGDAELLAAAELVGERGPGLLGGARGRPAAWLAR